MSKKKQRKHRSIKRLKHKHNYRQPLQNLSQNIINKDFLNNLITLNYTKYFDYSLSELLADHSTNPIQNTSRQYILLDTLNEGRFINHEMIIRKNGKSTILRPKQDIVLVNGFTPIIQPSYFLLSYQSVPLHSQIASSSSLSSSIINKMSIDKSEQTITNKKKRKRRRRRRRKRKSKIQKLIDNNQSQLSVKEKLHEISIHNLSSNNYRNQSLIQELEDICFNRNTIDKQQEKNNDIEFSYILPQKEYLFEFV